MGPWGVLDKRERWAAEEQDEGRHMGDWRWGWGRNCSISLSACMFGFTGLHLLDPSVSAASFSNKHGRDAAGTYTVKWSG